MELADLIRKILNPQQSERLGLEEIKRHVWMTMDLPAVPAVKVENRRPRIFELVVGLDSFASQMQPKPPDSKGGTEQFSAGEDSLLHTSSDASRFDNRSAGAAGTVTTDLLFPS
eukprot:SAG31_NODE_116_length_24094_cov_38.884184_19_plen_114_part_00